MPRRKTDEEFIRLVMDKHDGFYSYTYCKYIGMEDKIIITCPIHGDFLQTARSHLRGHGCKECSRYKKGRKRKPAENFVEKAAIIHNGIYMYTKSIYESMHKKLIITCQIHGNFWQTPHNHLKGQGCPECGKLSIINKNTKRTNTFVDDYIIRNNLLIKRLSDCFNSKTKVSFECLICNHIWITTSGSILHQKCGCSKCNDTRLTNEIIDSFLIENNIPIRRTSNHINAYTNNDWECLKCNNIWSAKSSEITRKGSRDGSGCPNCARNKNEKLVGETIDELNLKHTKMMIRLSCSNQKLFPDYFIPNINLIIEYNGIQHYQPICFGGQSIKEVEKCFEKQKLRDEILRLYCKENKISLLEIDGRRYKGKRLKEFIIEYFKERRI